MYLWTYVTTSYKCAGISARTKTLAKKNSRGLKNINFVQCFWLNSIGTSFDIIVSNPPYICDDDPHLKYLRHEPRLALKGGRDGLDPAREIIKTAKKNLVEKGRLYLEHGYDQKDDVTQILRQSDFCTIKSYKDFAGHDRVIKAHSWLLTIINWCATAEISCFLT